MGVQAEATQLLTNSTAANALALRFLPFFGVNITNLRQATVTSAKPTPGTQLVRMGLHVLHGAARHCMELHGATWGCMSPHGVAWGRIVKSPPFFRSSLILPSPASALQLNVALTFSLGSVPNVTEPAISTNTVSRRRALSSQLFAPLSALPTGVAEAGGWALPGGGLGLAIPARGANATSVDGEMHGGSQDHLASSGMTVGALGLIWEHGGGHVPSEQGRTVSARALFSEDPTSAAGVKKQQPTQVRLIKSALRVSFRDTFLCGKVTLQLNHHKGMHAWVYGYAERSVLLCVGEGAFSLAMCHWPEPAIGSLAWKLRTQERGCTLQPAQHHASLHISLASLLTDVLRLPRMQWQFRQPVAQSLTHNHSHSHIHILPPPTKLTESCSPRMQKSEHTRTHLTSTPLLLTPRSPSPMKPRAMVHLMSRPHGPQLCECLLWEQRRPLTAWLTQGLTPCWA